MLNKHFFKNQWVNERLLDESLNPPCLALLSSDLSLLLPTLGLAPSWPGSSNIQNQTIIHFSSLISTNFRVEHIFLRDQIGSLQRGISVIFFQMYIEGQSSHADPGKTMFLWTPSRSRSSFWEESHVHLKFDATCQKMSFKSSAALAIGLLHC